MHSSFAIGHETMRDVAIASESLVCEQHQVTYGKINTGLYPNCQVNKLRVCCFELVIDTNTFLIT